MPGHTWTTRALGALKSYPKTYSLLDGYSKTGQQRYRPPVQSLNFCVSISIFKTLRKGYKDSSFSSACTQVWGTEFKPQKPQKRQVQNLSTEFTLTHKLKASVSPPQKTRWTPSDKHPRLTSIPMRTNAHKDTNTLVTSESGNEGGWDMWILSSRPT